MNGLEANYMELYFVAVERLWMTVIVSAPSASDVDFVAWPLQVAGTGFSPTPLQPETPNQSRRTLGFAGLARTWSSTT
jgi:hypothetical protein